MIHHGDCIEVMATFEPDSIDAIVTDPPYGLGFMGKAWDHGVPGVPFWAEMLRVAKPGAHLLAFGGTRTVHRIATSIEDAGWEIRDTLVWAYASGFPKSLDVSKAMDKAAGAEREVTGRVQRDAHLQNRYADPDSDSTFVGTTGHFNTITAPATDLAREWQGWGTALKPAWEPIVLARKPLRGTVAGNVTEYGTGALNIDGCRIAHVTIEGGTLAQNTHLRASIRGGEGFTPGLGTGDATRDEAPNALGRWPANVILTDPIFDGDIPGVVGGGEARPSGEYVATVRGTREGPASIPLDNGPQYGDSGTYSRFFQLPRGESCDWCGASNAGPSSSPRSASGGSAPGRAVTPPDGEQVSMASADPATASGTNGTGTSTSPELPPATVSPLRQPASPAAQPTTSTATTTTTPGRWMCEHCAADAMRASTLPQPKPTRPALLVDGDDYPFAFIIPKAARTDREPVLGGLAAAEYEHSGPRGHTLNGDGSERPPSLPRRNQHPTVKPTDLMRHLVRLVTPPGGTVLDPFLGSGTTGLAAEMEGFEWVGIEREAEYVAIAEARLNGTQRGLGLAV